MHLTGYPSCLGPLENCYMKKALILLLMSAMPALYQKAQATLFYSEGFNYPFPGSLSGNDSWMGGSSGLTITNLNLTYPGLPDLGGNALLDASSASAGSMTVNFTGTAVTSGSIYYSFLAECSGLPTANNYLTDILVGGTTPNGGTDPLAVYVGQSVAGSAYRVGVRHNGNGTGATYTTNNSAFVVGNVNLFVVKYTFGSGGTVSLYANPTPGGTEPTPNVTVSTGTDASNLQTIGFKVNSGTSAGNWDFDSLRVGDSWADVTPVPEPSGLALAGMAALVLAAWRRARG